MTGQGEQSTVGPEGTAAEQGRPGRRARRAPGARFCRACRYELTGIDWSPAACPECGRVFSHDDPSTTLDSPRHPAARALFGKYAMAAVLGLLVVNAFVHTILPRPENLGDWRLWQWFWRRFGVEEGWVGAHPGRLHWWAGRTVRIEALTPAGGLAWDMEVRWGDRWTLRAHEAGIPWRELFAAFNAMKQEMFGVRFIDAQREVSGAEFESSGDKAQILSTLVRVYGMKLAPFRLREDQSYVWVYDDARGTMATLPIDEAEARGIEIGPVPRSLDPRPLLAVPRSP